VSADVGEVGPFGEILADEAIGIFVEAALPGMIGVGKVGIGPENLGKQLVQGEFFAVVVGGSEHLITVATGRLDDRAAHFQGLFGGGQADEGESAESLDHGHQYRTTRPADDGVHFPIADAGSLIHYRRTEIDHHLVGEAAAPLPSEATLPVGLAAVTEMAVLVSSGKLIAIDTLIDRLAADAAEFLHGYSLADLLRNPLPLA